MSCNKIKTLLSAYVDSALDAKEQALVEGHLASCESCRQALKQLEELQREVGSLKPMKAPASFKRSLMKQWDERASDDAPIADSQIRSRFRRPLWLGMAASFLIVGISIVFLITSQKGMLAPTETMASRDRQVADHVSDMEREEFSRYERRAGRKSSPELEDTLKSLGYSGSSDKPVAKLAKGTGKSTSHKKSDKVVEEELESAYVVSGAAIDGEVAAYEDADSLNIAAEDTVAAAGKDAAAGGNLVGVGSKGPDDVRTDDTVAIYRRSSPQAMADMIFVIDAKDTRISNNLIAMADSYGHSIRDFQARVRIPDPDLGEGTLVPAPAARETNPKKSRSRGKGPGKGPGKELKKGKTEEGTGLGYAEPEQEQEWLYVYVETDARNVPDLLAELSLSNGSSLRRGTLTRIQNSVDEAEKETLGDVATDWSGYEVTVSGTSMEKDIHAALARLYPAVASPLDYEQDVDEPSLEQVSPQAPLEKTVLPTSHLSGTGSASASRPSVGGSAPGGKAGDAVKPLVDLVSSAPADSLGEDKRRVAFKQEEPQDGVKTKTRRRVLLIFPKPKPGNTGGAGD